MVPVIKDGNKQTDQNAATARPVKKGCKEIDGLTNPFLRRGGKRRKMMLLLSVVFTRCRLLLVPAVKLFRPCLVYNDQDAAS
jgi:hypothetical protein